MSGEIIPPSGDENSSGSDFFSSITQSNNITQVLDHEIEQNDTS